MQYVAGSVPYVNARPLVSFFEHLGADSPVQLLYAVPSQLPECLDAGTCHVAMVSSFEALRNPGRKMSDAGCVGTRGAAESVRLFSKVPLDQIRTLALDASSLTSTHLGQVVLIERYGIRPQTVHATPDLNAMLAENDACLIIGDKGMLADGTGLQVLDLGAEWFALTGLPFVWAAWIGGAGLTAELSAQLNRAREWGLRHLDVIVAQTQAKVRWPSDSCRRYLRETMSYELSPDHLAGLRRFQELLLEHGFIANDRFPELVGAAPVAAI